MAVDETVKKSTFREYYEALLIAVIFVNFARIFAFQAFKIPTGTREDNLDRSSDSRYWGTVPRSMIKGRAFMVYWSFEGTPPSPDAPTSARIKELAGVVVHFFTKSRWERTFFIVDSKYHFTPGLTPEGEAGESP